MSVVQPFARPGVQRTIAASPSPVELAQHARQVAEAVNRHNQGQMNVCLFITLDPDVDTTLVVDSRISIQTCASFMPQTANAAAEIPTLYASCTNGSMTIHHLNSAAIDRDYTVAFIG